MPRVLPQHKVYFIAGNLRQAEFHAREKGFERGEWEYINDQRQLHGLHNIDVVFVGTWGKRPDASYLALAVAHVNRPPERTKMLRDYIEADIELARSTSKDFRELFEQRYDPR